MVRCGPMVWQARAGGPPRRCPWPRRGPRPAAPPGLWPWRGFCGVVARVRPRSPAPGWARSSCGPPLRRGRGCGSPSGGRGRGRFPPPPPALAYRRGRSPVSGPPGQPPSTPAAPPGGGGGPGAAAAPPRPGVGPPNPGPSGPPCLALAALRAALCLVGRPAAAAGSPLRAIPPGCGPRSSAPGGRWPAARAPGPLRAPPAGAPAPVRRGPFGPWCGGVGAAGAGRRHTRRPDWQINPGESP